MQDQRIARARASVERLEGELSSAAQESGRANTSLTEMKRMLDGERDSARRAQMETELKFRERQLKEVEALVPDLESRYSLAVQALAAETAQLEQLETLLGQLDRTLEGPKR